MVEWFNKQAGSDIGESKDDPRLLLIGLGKPDWVMVPDGTGHGGQYRCLDLRVGPCPLPGHDHECRHYLLDGPVWCAECTQEGKFVWYSRRE
jgi:hypothetical protein